MQDSLRLVSTRTQHMGTMISEWHTKDIGTYTHYSMCCSTFSTWDWVQKIWKLSYSMKTKVITWENSIPHIFTQRRNVWLNPTQKGWETLFPSTAFALPKSLLTTTHNLFVPVLVVGLQKRGIHITLQNIWVHNIQAYAWFWWFRGINLICSLYSEGCFCYQYI